MKAVSRSSEAQYNSTNSVAYSSLANAGAGGELNWLLSKQTRLKRQPSLRAVLRAWASQMDGVEVARMAGMQRVPEAPKSSRIHYADARLQNAFGVSAGLVGVTFFIAVTDLRGRWDSGVVLRDRGTKVLMPGAPGDWSPAT